MNTITKQLTHEKILVNWLVKLSIHLVWGAGKHLFDLIPARFVSKEEDDKIEKHDDFFLLKLIVCQFYAHINLSETVQERVMMILLDKLVVKIIRLKIPAMQDLIRKKPNCQEAWQSFSKIGEFPNLGENAKILRMQVWKWSKLFQSCVRWPTQVKIKRSVHEKENEKVKLKNMKKVKVKNMKEWKWKWCVLTQNFVCWPAQVHSATRPLSAFRQCLCSQP